MYFLPPSVHLHGIALGFHLQARGDSKAPSFTLGKFGVQTWSVPPSTGNPCIISLRSLVALAMLFSETPVTKSYFTLTITQSDHKWIWGWRAEAQYGCNSQVASNGVDLKNKITETLSMRTRLGSLFSVSCTSWRYVIKSPEQRVKPAYAFASLVHGSWHSRSWLGLVYHTVKEATCLGFM